MITWQSAAISWGSRKQKSIALSTCEVEIIALSEVAIWPSAKDVIYLRKLVKGLGDPEVRPTPLSTDSKSARDVSYNPEHHDKMKHVERRHFYVRDMVESFEIEGAAAGAKRPDPPRSAGSLNAGWKTKPNGKTKPRFIRED